MRLFSKIVRDIMSFPKLPKRICFSGLGEPLMNPNLSKMAKELRNSGFDGRVDIITNGVALSPSVSDELIDSGINRIQISVQALTPERYEDIAGFAVDMDKYVENIRYLYEYRKNTEIYIKIIDANLNNNDERNKFYNMFSHICDTIYIEHLVVMEKQMGDHGGITDRLLNLNNEPFESREVCGIMFYFLQVGVDGDTFPCSTPGLPASFSMGNVKDNSLAEIWDGTKRHSLLCSNLINGYRHFSACDECSSVICITDPAEYLDDCRGELYERIKRNHDEL
jgi:MoaA/NifB/PqqE/SkfB family radical SAM enzyme